MAPILRLFLVSALSASAVYAADPASPEAKLRDQLRNAMLQTRTLQGERDTLQAQKTQLETEKKTAEEQAAKLQKQIAADKEAADKTIASLQDKSTAQESEVARLNAALEKWKAGHAEVTGIAQKKETERAKLAQEKIELERIVADQRTRNLGMYRVGKEVLDRYEKFGLGTALAAREPFTGTMRVKLENLVQDLGDKLAAERIKPAPGPAEPPKPANVQPAPSRPPAPKPADLEPRRTKPQPRSPRSATT